MAANRPPQGSQPVDLSNPANRHEHLDINAVAITRFGIVLVILCIFSFALVLGVFRFLQTREDARQTPVDAALKADRRPQPRLQSTPIPDLKTVLDGENAWLESYGQLDAGKGIVRVPIGVAMDLLAARGLPSRDAKSVPESSVSTPSESGLGLGSRDPLASAGPTAVEVKPAASGAPSVPGAGKKQ